MKSSVVVSYAENHAKKLLIIPFSDNSDRSLLVVINTQTDEIFKIFTMETNFVEKTIKNIRFRHLDNGIMASYQVINNSLVSDEINNRELGPRKKGETFNGCFARNWTSFCDGLVGCIAQATNPVIVGAAIAIECSGSPS